MKPIEICQANKGICKMHVFGKICPLDPFQGGFYCPDTCEHKIDGVCTVRGFFLSKMTGRRTCPWMYGAVKIHPDFIKEIRDESNKERS